MEGCYATKGNLAVVELQNQRRENEEPVSWIFCDCCFFGSTIYSLLLSTHEQGLFFFQRSYDSFIQNPRQVILVNI